MTIIAALVHSQGIVVERKFYALEIAYVDITGGREVFLVNSPFSFNEIRSTYPRLPITVRMTRDQGTPYSEVVKFLRQRYEFLLNQFPSSSVVVFGHKGESFQKDVLEQAKIPRFNVETTGIPSLAVLERMYPHIANIQCPHHVGFYTSKCAYRCILLLEEVSKSIESNKFSFSNDNIFS